MQVAVEPSLVDRVERAEAHRDGRELPEVGHQPGVRVGRQPTAEAGVRKLLAEPVKPLLVESPLEEGPRIHARRGVPLVVDLVAAARVVLAAEEVVEANLVQRRTGRVRRNVTAHADARALRAVDHDRGVPPDRAPDRALEVLVAGEPRLRLGRDRVDVVGADQAGHADLPLASMLQEGEHQVARAGTAALVNHRVEGLEPLPRLVRVDVRQLARQPVADDRGALCDHGRPPSGASWAPFVLFG